MDTLHNLDLLLENLMYNILGHTFPINLTTKILFLVFSVILFFLLIGIISDFISWIKNQVKKFFSPQKQSTKPDQDSYKNNDLIEKQANLYYQEIVTSQHANSDWEHTDRTLRGIYIAEKPDDLQEREKGYLILRFNGEWFFFRDPKALSSYQIEIFDKKVKKLNQNQSIDFDWGMLTLQTLPKYTSNYKVNVDGHYPHLVQYDKRVFLLPAKIKKDSTENNHDNFYLFEDIELVGGISWQKRKLFLWTGDLLTEEEVAELQEDYLDLPTKGAEPDVKMMK